MPELPEVELAAAYLRDRLVGADALAVVLHEPGRDETLDALGRLAVGRLVDVRRHGKQLALDFGSGDTLLLHLGMTGRFGPPGPASAAPPHTRVTFRAPARETIHFIDPRRFARFALCPTSDAARHPAWASLGPDALVATEEDWLTALRGAGPVKPALLEQSRLAGVGNIYACEGLWAAGLHPLRRAGTLDAAEVARLREAIRASMFETLRRDADTPMRYVNEGAVENPFLVYGREGAPCPRCGTSLERIKQAGRSTWLCPSCQPATGAAVGRP